MLEYNTTVSNMWGATALDKSQKLITKSLENVLYLSVSIPV